MHQYHRCYWWWWLVGLLAVTTVCCSFSNHPSSSILVRAEEEQQDQCVDNHEKCPQWASQGECEINANYMLRECRFSCDNCHHEDDEDYLNDDGDDGDEYDDEDEDEEDDEEDPNEIFPRVVSSEDLARGIDLGIAQRLRGFPDDHDTWSADVSWMITKARSYMNHVVPRKFGDDMKQLCRHKDENCAYWALLGECEANPECKYQVLLRQLIRINNLFNIVVIHECICCSCRHESKLRPSLWELLQFDRGESMSFGSQRTECLGTRGFKCHV